MNENDAVLSWLTLNDPELHTGPHGIYQAMAKDNLISLAAVTSESAPAQSGITGKDKDAALKLDQDAQAAKDKYGPTSKQFINIFKKDLAGGATTLSEMARIAANYQPQTLDNTGATAVAYNDYLRRMGTNPLFILRFSDVLQYKRDTSDWNTVIDAIADTFEGIASKDKDTIAKGLKTLAQAASSKMSSEQTENVFVQNAINVDGVVSLYLYNSQVTFKEESGKGYDTKQVNYSIQRVKFELQAALWPVYAERVAAKFTASVDDWLDNNSTTTAGTNKIPALEPY